MIHQHGRLKGTLAHMRYVSTSHLLTQRIKKPRSWMTVLLMLDNVLSSASGVNSTVKHVLSGHSKIDKAKFLMTNGSLMKVESIAECSPWSILQYFDLH